METLYIAAKSMLNAAPMDMIRIVRRIRRPPAGGTGLVVTVMLSMLAGIAYDIGFEAVAYAIAAITTAWLLWFLLWQLSGLIRGR